MNHDVLVKAVSASFLYFSKVIIYFFKYLIYLFGCVRSLVVAHGIFVVVPGLFIVARRLLSSCGTWALEHAGLVAPQHVGP